jgi:peptidoglycan hydrolase CwlO-like protein
LVKDIEQKQKAINDLLSANKAMKSAIGYTRLPIKALNIDRNTSTILSLKAVKCVSNKSIGIAFGNISALNVIIGERNKKIENLTKEIIIRNATIDELNKNITILTKQIDDLTKQITQMKLDIDRLTQENIKKDAKIKELEESIVNKTKEVDDWKNKIKDLNKTIDNLKLVIKDNEKTINDLLIKIKQQNETIAELKNNNTERDTKIAELTKQVNDLNETIKNYTKSITEKEELIVNLIRDIDVANKTIEANKQVIKDKQAQIVKMNEDITNLTKQKADIEKIVNELEIKILELKNKKIDLEKQADELKKKHKEKDDIIDQLQKDIDLKNEVIRKQNDTIYLRSHRIYELNITLKELTISANTLDKTNADLLNSSNQCVKEMENKIIPEVQMGWLKYQILEGYGASASMTRVFSSQTQGFTRSAFIHAVSNVAPGLFIGKEAFTGLSFGGFTKERFNESSKFKTDPSAFTFSLSSYAKCKIKPGKQTEAIYDGGKYSYQTDVLAFGNWDLWISENSHDKESEIKKGVSYNCPEQTNAFFYSKNELPKIDSIEYYKVDITKPKF